MRLISSTDTPLNSLSQALSLMVTIDHIFTENTNWTEGWREFSNMMQIVKSNLAEFGITKADYSELVKKVKKYEKTLIKGECYKVTIGLCFDPEIENSPLIRENKALKSAIEEYLKRECRRIEGMLGTQTDSHIDRQQIIGLLSLFGLHARLFNSVDSGLYRRLWALQKKVSIVNVKCHINFRISVFLNRYVKESSKVSRLEPKRPEE